MTDSIILEQLRVSPADGLQIAIARYGGAVHTITASILRGCNEADIEEAISDTFAKLWQNRDRIGGGAGKSLKSYLYEIARNTALDFRRRLVRESAVCPLEDEYELSDGVQIEETVESSVVSNTVRGVVNALSEPDRSIFLLRFFYFLSVKDIAAQLQLTPKSVENRLCRGKEALRQKLEEGGIQYA